MLLQMARFHFFNSWVILHYISIAISIYHIFIYSSIDEHLGCFPYLGCCSIMLLWTLRCMYIFELVFLFSLEKYPGVEFLHHMIVLFLMFWRNTILFSIVAAPIYIPTNSAGPLSFILHCLLLSSCDWILFFLQTSKPRTWCSDFFLPFMISFNLCTSSSQSSRRF